MKQKVVILFGGRSGEHEVSLRSAASVYRFLDREKFEPLLVGISKTGKWFYQKNPQFTSDDESLILTLEEEVVLPPYPPQPGKKHLMNFAKGGTFEFDLVFPVMHGTFCEDGTLQGYLDLGEVPYVGCGVLGSSVGMDKAFAKVVLESVGIPVVPYILLNAHEKNHEERVSAFGYPCFIKPSNSGSSVGVHKVKKASDLPSVLEDAFQYDSVLLVEKALNVREIECAAIESDGTDGAKEGVWVSVPGELKVNHEFYSYEAKYLDSNGATPLLPAPLSEEQTKEVQSIVRKTFNALRSEGMARVDLFLDKDSGRFYINEINTLPGFTSISMFPKMCEVSGLSYKELLTKLLNLASKRSERKSKLKREFTKLSTL